MPPRNGVACFRGFGGGVASSSSSGVAGFGGRRRGLGLLGLLQRQADPPLLDVHVRTITSTSCARLDHVADVEHSIRGQFRDVDQPLDARLQLDESAELLGARHLALGERSAADSSRATWSHGLAVSCRRLSVSFRASRSTRSTATSTVWPG